MLPIKRTETSNASSEVRIPIGKEQTQTNNNLTPSTTITSNIPTTQTHFSLPIEAGSSKPLKTPLQLTEHLWIVRLEDLPPHIQIEMNPGIDLFLIEPETLSLNDIMGYKGIKLYESINAENVSYLFSPKALKDFETISLVRRDLNDLEIAQRNISQTINLTDTCDISFVSMKSYAPAISNKPGLENTFVSRANLQPLPIQEEPTRSKDFFPYLFYPLSEESMNEFLPDINQEFGRCCNVLGIPKSMRPQIVFKRIPTLGNYNPKENTLAINSDIQKNNLTLYDVLNSIFHETYHSSRTLYASMILTKEERLKIVLDSFHSRLESGEPICQTLDKIKDPNNKDQISKIIQAILKDHVSWEKPFEEYFDSQLKQTKETTTLRAKILSVLLGENISTETTEKELNTRYKAKFEELLQSEKLVYEIGRLISSLDKLSGSEVKSYKELYGVETTDEQTAIAKGYLKEVVDLFIITNNLKKTSETQAYYYFCPEETNARNFQLLCSLKILQEQEKAILESSPTNRTESLNRLLRKNKNYQDICNERIKLNSQCSDLLILFRMHRTLNEQINRKLNEQMTLIKESIRNLEDLWPNKYSEHTVAHDLCLLVTQSIDETK